MPGMWQGRAPKRWRRLKEGPLTDVSDIVASLSRMEKKVICRPEMTVDGRVIIDISTPAWAGNRSTPWIGLHRKGLTKLYSVKCHELTELGLAVRKALEQR